MIIIRIEFIVVVTEFQKPSFFQWLCIGNLAIKSDVIGYCILKLIESVRISSAEIFCQRIQYTFIVLVALCNCSTQRDISACVAKSFYIRSICIEGQIIAGIVCIGKGLVFDYVCWNNILKKGFTECRAVSNAKTSIHLNLLCGVRFDIRVECETMRVVFSIAVGGLFRIKRIIIKILSK